LSAFIGKNDAGKSSVLEALEVFFNNELIVCEREDLNIHATDTNIEISCVFSSDSLRPKDEQRSQCCTEPLMRWGI
jgi:AAA15 family ATPase/GTPase